MNRIGGLLLGTVLLALSCAQEGRPTGGPKDQDPPEIVKTFPENKTLNFSEKTIRLYFDEPIRKPAYDKEIFISPYTRAPVIKLSDSGKRLTLEFQEDLRPDATYVITLNGIKDFRESNEIEETYRLAFSTGNQLDSLAIQGEIISYVIGGKVSDMTVLLFDADSIEGQDFLRKRPAYLAKADAQGKFEFQYLRDTEYRILAIRDDDKSNTYSGGIEMVAMSADTILRFPEPDTNRIAQLDSMLSIDSMIIPLDTMGLDSSRLDTAVLDSAKGGGLQSDSTLIDSSLAIPPIDSSSILFVKLYAFTPDPYLPNVKGYQWVADSTVQVRFTKNLRLEGLVMYATDTLGLDSTMVDCYSWWQAQDPSLLVHMPGGNETPAELHMMGLFDSLRKPLDTVLRILPPSRIRSFDDPIIENPSLNLTLGAWELFLPRRYRPGKAAFFLTDTAFAVPDTLEFGLRDSGFRQYLSPIPAPDTVLPYYIRLGGSWAQPEDEEYRDSTFIYAVNWYDPAAYGLMTGRVILDSPFVPPIVMNLLDGKSQVVGTVRDTVFKFQFLAPGTYKAQIILDADSSGHWTTGDLEQRRFPEQIFNSQEELTIRANWELLDQEVRVSLAPPTQTDTATQDSTAPPTRMFGAPGLGN